MFGLSSSSTRPTSKKQFKTKQHFKENKLSGLYQEFDPYTDELREEGNFRDGVETGKWRVIDQDGDEIHYQYSMVRVGALCQDGTTSSATGRGACSWHGGVSEWLYGAEKNQVGGTGKYMPAEQRVQALREKVKGKFKINKFGLELEEQILKLVLGLAEKTEKLGKELITVKEELEAANEELDELYEEKRIEKEKEEAKEKEKGKEKEKEEKKPIIVNNFTQNKNVENKLGSKDKLQPAKLSPTKPSQEKEEKKPSKEKQPEKKEAPRLPNPYEQDEDLDWQDQDEEQEQEETAEQQYSLIHDLLARMNLK